MFSQQDACCFVALSAATAAFAQKPGGVLTVYNWDNPPSLSIHEEITNATLVPMMGLFQQSCPV